MWAYVSASCHGLLECTVLMSATLDLICTVYIVWVMLCGMSTLDTVDKSYQTIMWSTGSMVHPKVVKSVHYCPATTKTIERKYSDLTSLESFPTSAAYPTKVCHVIFLNIIELLCYIIGWGWKSPGDRIWLVRLQGSPNLCHTGDARTSTCWPAASLNWGDNWWWFGGWVQGELYFQILCNYIPYFSQEIEYRWWVCTVVCHSKRVATHLAHSVL